MFSLGQSDLHDPVFALGADFLRIDVDRKFKGSGELAGAKLGAVNDLSLFFDERFALTTVSSSL